jgi:hypothetical protein
LVTDLPADFDVALQGVDTRLKALQPGTTLGDLAYSSATANTNTRLPVGTNGQVLAVSGGVPTWTTTADVTPLTTKGDLFTFTTVDARIGVGANGTVLTADSAEATGMKWATAGTALVGVAAIAASATLSVSAHTQHTLPLPAENFDTDGFHSTSSNTSRITIPTGKGGKYLIQGQLQNDSTGNYAYLIFMKNGSNTGMSAGTPGAFIGRIQDNSGNTYGLSGSSVVELAADDYIELGFQSDQTRTMTYDCRFSAIFLGA